MDSNNSSDNSDEEYPDVCEVDYCSESYEPTDLSASSDSDDERPLVPLDAIAIMHTSEVNLNTLQQNPQTQSISRVDSSLQDLYNVDRYLATTIKKDYTLDHAKPLPIYDISDILDRAAYFPHYDVVSEPDLHNRTLYNECDFDEETAQYQSMQIESEDKLPEEDMVAEITKSISLTRVTDGAEERHENPSKRERADHENLDSIHVHPKRKRFN